MSITADGPFRVVQTDPQLTMYVGRAAKILYGWSGRLSAAASSGASTFTCDIPNLEYAYAVISAHTLARAEIVRISSVSTSTYTINGTFAVTHNVNDQVIFLTSPIVPTGILGIEPSGSSTDYITYFQRHIDSLESIGGGTLVVGNDEGSYYKITLPIAMKNNVSLIGVGQPIIRNTSSYGDWADAVIIMGSHHDDYYDDYTQYNLSSILPGAMSVTCSTAAEAGNFADGDMVVIRTSAYSAVAVDGGNAVQRPLFAELNRVTGADAGTGVVSLGYPVSEELSGCVITKATGVTERDIDSYLCHSAEVSGLFLKSASGHGILLNGALKCTVYCEIDAAQDAVVVRLARWCDVKATVRFQDRAIGLHTGAHNNTIKLTGGKALTNLNDVPILDLTGHSRHNTVIVDLDAESDYSDSATDGVVFDGCRDNTVTGHINGWATYNDMVAFRSSYHESAPTFGNKFSANYVGGRSGWSTVSALRIGNVEISDTFTVVTATDTLTNTSSSSLQNGMPVRFTTTGTLPGGLSLATTYYVRDKSGTSYKVSATPMGSAVDITSTGSGTHTVTSYMAGPQDNVVEGCSIYPYDGTAVYAAYLADGSGNIIRNVILPEQPALFKTGFTGNLLLHNRLDGISGSSDADAAEANTLIGILPVRVAPNFTNMSVINEDINSTTTNNIVDSAMLAVGTSVQEGDSVDIEISGYVTGTNGTKTIAVAHGAAEIFGTAVVTHSFDAGQTGGFWIRYHACITSGTTYDEDYQSYSAADGAVYGAGEVTVASISASGLSFSLIAYVANASDTIHISRAHSRVYTRGMEA